jgi:HEAT repeat protein
VIALFTQVALAGWTDDVAASVAACATEPAPCEAAASVFLRPTRAGHLMAQDPRLFDPAVTGPLIHRLLTDPDPAVRAGLADGLARALADRPDDTTWHAAWADLAATHPDEAVRSVLIASLRRAPIGAAGPGLRAALGHADPVTRAAAASKMGGHADAKGFVPDLLAATRDADPRVRSMAARALGWAGDASALARLRELQADEDAAVREESGQAIERLGK